MSILIKGVEMPESCMACPFSVSVNFGAVCCPTHTTIPDSKLFNDVGEPTDRQPWCPLIEIQKHGRLIDADALIERYMPDMNRQIYGGNFIFDIEHMPTIIEAEEA